MLSIGGSEAFSEFETMSETYTSEWMQLWRRWTEYERRWEGDPRGVLIGRLVQGAPAKRNETIATWTRNEALPQPEASDLTELSALGDRLQVAL
jgi:hypothetical protein